MTPEELRRRKRREAEEEEERARRRRNESSSLFEHTPTWTDFNYGGSVPDSGSFTPDFGGFDGGASGGGGGGGEW